MFGKVKKFIAGVLALTMLITLAPSQLVTVMADTRTSGSVSTPQSGGGTTYDAEGMVGDSITLTSKNGTGSHSWQVVNNVPSSDYQITPNGKSATIVFNKAGTYTVRHSYRNSYFSWNYYREDFTVNVMELSPTILYVYMDATQIQNGTLNPSGYYTIGKVTVSDPISITNDWVNMTDTIRGYLNNLDERFDKNKNISLDNIVQYRIVEASGADDYVTSGTTYHLDLKPDNAKVKLRDVTINYVDADGNAIAETKTIPGTVGNEIDLSAYVIEIEGYTFKTAGSLSTYPKYTIVEGDNNVNLVYDKNVTTVKVAVYATDGSPTGSNANLESLLGISYKQEDGYYPIGVIEVPESLVSGNSPYIKSRDDWNTIAAAIQNISTDELIGDGLANKGNTIYEHLDTVQVDTNSGKGYGAGTWHTAMFDWNDTSANISGDYAYHLDLRFATNLLTVKGVYEQADGTFAVDNNNLVQVPYLKDEKTKAPSFNVPEGYQAAGYYSDKDLTTTYTFGDSITSDQTVYVKLVRKNYTYTINYYWKGDLTKAFKTETDTAPFGSEVTADTEITGYTLASPSAAEAKLTISADSTANVLDLYYYKDITVTANDKSKTYGDEDPVLTATLSDPSVQLVYSVTREEGENADTYTITPSGNEIQGAYSVSYVTGTFTINRKAVTVTADNKTQAYGGTAKPLTATVTGLVGTDSKDIIEYEISREQGDAVRTYTITVTGDKEQGNYTVSYVNGTYRITQADTLSVVATNASKTYDGTPLESTAVSVSDSEGSTIEYSIDGGTKWTTTAPTRTDAGTTTVNVRVTNPSYSNTATATYTLTVNRANVTVAADPDQGKTYGDADPTLTATPVGLFGTDKVTYSATRAEGENAGEYDITVTGELVQGNYNVTYEGGTFVISKKNITVTPVNAEKQYGTEDPAFTASVNGLVGTDTVEYAVVRDTEESEETAETLGNHTIIATGEADQGNYTVTFKTGTLTIIRREIKDPDPEKPGEYPDEYDGIKVGTIDDVVYTGEPQELVPSVPGLEKDKDFVVSYSDDTTNAGTVTVTVKGIGNYTGEVTRTYNINKRVVTLTSASAGKVFDGTALTAQSVTVSGQGFAKSEGNGVTYIFSGAQKAIGSSANAFEYTLNTAVINPNNYDITVVFGTLTVAAAPATEPNAPTPITVTHTLTIHYVDAAGNAVAPDYVGTFVTGSAYLVASPVVLGYTPQFASVASPEGGMPDMDVEVSVLYTPNVPAGGNTPNVPAGGNTPNTPAGGNTNVDNGNAEIPDADVPQGALSVDENGDVEIVEIEDEETALAANDSSAWALINLLAMIATAILGIILLVLALKKKEDENTGEDESEKDEDESKEKNKKVLKLCGLIPAIASVIVFFVTENMKNPMAYVDKWTVLMVILLVVEIVLAVLSRKKKEKDEDEKQKAVEA